MKDGYTTSTSVWAAPIVPPSPWDGEVTLFLCGEEDALVDPDTGTIAGTLVPAADLRLDRPLIVLQLLNNLWFALASYVRDALVRLSVVSSQLTCPFRQVGPAATLQGWHDRRDLPGPGARPKPLPRTRPSQRCATARSPGRLENSYRFCRETGGFRDDPS